MTWVPESSASVLSGTPIAGSVEEITALSTFASDVSLDAYTYQLNVQNSQRELSTLTAAAITGLSAKIQNTLVPGATTLIASADTAKSAFDNYAAEVERIHSTARSTRNSVNTSLDNIRSQARSIADIAAKIRFYGANYIWNQGAPLQLPEPQLSWRDEDLDAAERSDAIQTLKNRYSYDWSLAASSWQESITAINKLVTAWNTLIDERKRAEKQLLSKLGETAIGQLITLAAGSGQTRKSVIAYAFSGELWGNTSGALQMNTDHPLLKKLIGSESGANAWDSPPNPVDVAKNWASLTPAEQQTLITMVPWVIGNLPGLPYGVRDQANNLTLRYYAMHRDYLGGSSISALDQLIALKAAGEGKEPPVMLVAVDLAREVPMVAVGYGNLDSADQLTWQVPGMESDAHNAMGVWDKASRNLYNEQKMLTEGYGNIGLGVISFLSYDTPDLKDSLGSSGVLSPDQARQGAYRLAAELDGTWAARNVPLGIEPGGWTIESPRISVTAHSYGTTTATNALSMVQHTVDSYSMAGSAGIDTGTVTSIDQLNVADNIVDSAERKAVYASHASGDGLAPLGLSASGRGNPNAAWNYDGHVNWTDAYSYPSDGTVAGYSETDGHSVIGANSTDWLGDAKHAAGFESSKGHGYWDQGTQSLRNLAASSLGYDWAIVK